MSQAHNVEVATTPVAAGLRAMGVVVAAGYLSGLVSGPVVGAVGGLALVTFGRCIGSDRAEAALTAAALGVFASGLGVSALRWSSLDLGAIRGAQGVLGATLEVGPTEVAVAAGLGAGACLLALVAWLMPLGKGAWPLGASIVEAVAGGLAIATLYWGPALADPTEPFEASAGLWVLVSAVAAGLAFGGALAGDRLGSRARRRLQVGLVAVAALLVAAGATLVSSNL